MTDARTILLDILGDADVEKEPHMATVDRILAAFPQLEGWRTPDGPDVTYALVDGTHMISSASDRTLGLCAGHQDIGTAIGAAIKQLFVLLALNPPAPPADSSERGEE